MYQVKTPFCTNKHYFFYLSADTPVYDFLESCLRHKSEVKVILVVYGKKQSYFPFFLIIMTLYSLKLFTCRSYIILPEVFLQDSYENRQTDKPDSVIPM